MATMTDYVGTLFSDKDDPNKITVALTMAAKALEKGHSASVILMVDAVYLAKRNSLADIDIGAPFKPAAELLENFLQQGGNVLVCGACMQHNGVEESEIEERYQIITADDVVDLVMDAKGSLQLT